MGFVCNVMLSFSDEEFWPENREEALKVPRALAEINQWLAKEDGPLKSLVRNSGGIGLNANIFGGGFRHFDLQSFVSVVANQAWRDFQSIQLFVKDEDETTWRIVKLEPVFTSISL